MPRPSSARACAPICSPAGVLPGPTSAVGRSPVSHPHPELGAPPAARATAALRVVALGGLGEIGRNMTVFEHAGQLLIIDCGVLFPEDHQPGVDLILPDFDYIRDRLDDIEAIVLTHGHEDHIGAVPYLLREQARHPARRLQADPGAHRGQAAGAPHHARTPSEVEEGDREQLGPFDCEFVAVNHSIPDALAVAIRTAGGTGPAHRRLQDGPAAAGRPAHRPARLRPAGGGGRRPVPHRLDQRRGARLHHPRARHRAGASTRSSVTAASAGSSSPASPPTCTASSRSSTPRAGTAARSRSSAARWSATWASPRDLGYLHVPDGVLVDVKKLDDLPDDQVVLVCTGSQGEPMAALSRMANRDHRIDVGEGDTVLLASLADPGQRERRLPRDQRPDAAGAPTSCTRATPRCTCPATPAPASCSTATTSSSRAT